MARIVCELTKLKRLQKAVVDAKAAADANCVDVFYGFLLFLALLMLMLLLLMLLLPLKQGMA